MWALAEVLWERTPGVVCRLPATIEDTSASGACLRVDTPISVGTKLTVKWQWDQFSAIARNCRRDGAEFLCGVQRDGGGGEGRPQGPAGVRERTADDAPGNGVRPDPDERLKDGTPAGLTTVSAVEEPVAAMPDSPDSTKRFENSSHDADKDSVSRTQSLPFSQEKEVMSTKDFFSKLYRSQESVVGSESIPPKEPAMPKSEDKAASVVAASPGNLLSSEDIYRASGILHPHSKYGIMKIVEMLESKHIRELPPDVKRASVLMALEASGTSVDEVVQDAARRQHALNAYESGQKQQFEEFEAHKTRENTRIQAELERVVAHYSERLKQNLEQVEREKEALRTWQAMKEGEFQRISEAVAVCSRQPAAQPSKEKEAPPFPSVQAKSAGVGKV
jgi:hypothetical protein